MAAKRKTPGMKNMGNRELYTAMLGKRLSNAAGSHDNRPNRQRTRSTSKRVAISNSGW